jgi:hypothetical protein
MSDASTSKIKIKILQMSVMSPIATKLGLSSAYIKPTAIK